MANKNEDLGVKIPAFTGEADSATTVEMFTIAVDEAAKVFSWSPEQAATLAVSKLEGYVKLRWYQVKTQASKSIRLENLDKWVVHGPAPPGAAAGALGPLIPDTGLRHELIKRFRSEDLDPAVVTARLNDLVQARGETVADFVSRVESTCYDYSLALHTPERRAEEDDYDRWFTETLHLKLRAGFRQAIRDHLDSWQKDRTDFGATIRVAEEFEKSEAGKRELGRIMPNRRVAAVEASDNEKEVKVSAAKAPAGKRKAPKDACAYCGIKGHKADECYKKRTDVEAGIIRDRHADYPCIPLRERKKLAAKKAAGAATTPAPPAATPTPSATATTPAPSPSHPPPLPQMSALSLQAQAQQLMMQAQQMQNPEVAAQMAAIAYTSQGVMGGGGYNPYNTIQHFQQNQKN